MSTDCVAVFDPDGRIERVNPGLLDVMEAGNEGAVIGRNWLDFYQGPEQLRAEAALAAVGRGEASHFRGNATTFKGTSKYLDVQLRPVAATRGRPRTTLCVARDITVERRNEQRLLEVARRIGEAARVETENLRRLLHNAPSIMCVLRGPTHRFELVNEAALQLAGHRDLLGLTAREAFPGPDGEALIVVLDAVYKTGEPFIATDAPVKLQRQPGDPYEEAFLNMVFQPIRDEAGAVSGVFIEGTDITGRVKAERALSESERRLRLAQEVAGIGSLEVDVDTGETRGSEQFWRIWGLPPSTSVNISVLEGIVIPEDSALRSNVDTRHAGTAVPKVEYRIRRPDTGEIRWVARHIEFVQDTEGKPTQMIGVMQDITERKEIEEQRALLTRELEHRMKNTLAMVGAIATQTLKGDDMESARAGFVSRLTALSSAHDILMLRSWTSAPISGVVEAALAPHGSGESRLIITGPDLLLTAKQALALSLGLHELATNAAKYGALSNTHGKVLISWSVEEADEPLFRLSWVERDGPSVTAPKRRGFGSRLIERVMSADFGGTIRIDYDAEGVTCVLEAPLANLPSSDSDANSPARGTPTLDLNSPMRRF